MLNVLIAEDEKYMLDILSKHFEREEFNVLKANKGTEAIEIFEGNKIDLAILDWIIPEIDGIDVCRYIKENSNTRVLILTAKSQNDDEIEALEFGADEYGKKPFAPRILIIRAKKLINYGYKTTVGDITIDITKKRIYKGDKEIKLTKNEFELLMVFVKNK